MAFWIVFAVFLFFASAFLLVVEIFVPSFGLLTISSLACLAGGVAIFFQYGNLSGWIGVGIAAVIIPITWITAYRKFPKTQFGRSVTLTGPKRQKGDAIADTPRLKDLIDKIGVVTTPLRPVGTCDFAGQRVECVAESGYVDRGKNVKVISIMGTQVTVRVINES